MNELILKLAKQSGMRSPDLFKLTVSHMSTDTLEKFAELIVQECAKIADDGCGSACFGLGINGAMLKEHFGVEE